MLAVDRLDESSDPRIDTTGAPTPDALPDAHEVRPGPRFDGRKLAKKTFDATWPKLAAFAIFIFVWQCVVWWGYRPHVIKSPGEVARAFATIWNDGVLPKALSFTLR